ncbi:MAG: glycosyltransferase [Microgenomates group bacterium]
MVQKSNTNEKLNLLITIGLIKSKFTRLDKLLEYKNKTLNPKDLINKIKSAKKIITHVGPGTLFLITKYAKYLPLIIPRKKKFKEHVDDHQYYFAQFIQKYLPKKYQKYIILDDKIDEKIYEYLQEKPKSNVLNKYFFKSNSKEKINAREKFKKLINKLLQQ